MITKKRKYKRFDKKKTTELAKIWYDSKTPQNANNVILAMDEFCWWLVNKKKKMTDNTRISPDDLHQEARYGVWRAMRTYMPDKGCFVSYASYWAQQRIGLHINKEMHMIKFPQGEDDRSVCYAYSQIEQIVYNEKGTIGTSKLHEEIAKRTGLSMESILAYYRKTSAPTDIDGNVRRGSGDDGKELRTYANYLPDNPSQESDTIRSLDVHRLHNYINTKLESYSDRDRDLVCRHMSGEKMATGARHHGITRERVRQIVSAAEAVILKKCMAQFA